MRTSKIFLLLLPLAIIACTPREIETESLHKQLLISEQRSVDKVYDLLKKVSWYGKQARQEDIDVAEEVKKTLNLKKALGIRVNSKKNILRLSNKPLQTYFDSITLHLLKIDSSYYTELVQKEREKFSTFENKNLDHKYHRLLQLSMLEGKLFSIYRDSIGVGATFDIYYPCVAFRKEVLMANKINQIVITPVAKMVDDYFRLTYSNSMLYKEGSQTPLPHSFKQLGNAAIVEFTLSEPGNYEYEVGVNKSPETQRLHYVTEKFELVEETDKN